MAETENYVTVDGAIHHNSTKTTAGIIKLAWEAKKMAPCADGIRRSRAVWVRRSRQMLHDTSIKDFLSWYPEGEAGEYFRTDNRFVMRFDDVELEVLFRPMEDEADINRILSLQLSFAVVDEAREISMAVFEALQGRLGRYPDKKMVPPRPEWGVDSLGNPIGGCVDDNGKSMKRIWAMTNPPPFDTEWSEFLLNPPETAHVTFQPSGMSPEADWLQYLPENYYSDLAEGKSQEYIDQYIHGKFAISLSGKPVFRAFSADTHLAKEPLVPLPTTLVIGVDAGLTPAAVLTQQTYDGRVIVLDELVSEGMGALRFVRERLKPLLANKYPGAQVAVVIDPAAFQRVQTDERCVADIFKNEGFAIRPAKSNLISARLAAVDAFLTRTVDNKAAFLVSPTCSNLIAAMRGRYRYKVNTKGETEAKPEKNEASHVSDALQYAMLHHDGGASFGMKHGTARQEVKPAPFKWAV